MDEAFLTGAAARPLLAAALATGGNPPRPASQLPPAAPVLQRHGSSSQSREAQHPRIAAYSLHAELPVLQDHAFEAMLNVLCEMGFPHAEAAEALALTRDAEDPAAGDARAYSVEMAVEILSHGAARRSRLPRAVSLPQDGSQPSRRRSLDKALSGPAAAPTPARAAPASEATPLLLVGSLLHAAVVVDVTPGTRSAPLPGAIPSAVA